MNKKADLDNSRNLDQFYTNPEYAKVAYEVVLSKVDISSFDLLLEPSAGTGNFFLLLDSNKRLGFDLDPKHNLIQKQDFLLWQPQKKYNKILAIGNPPFGKNSKLAVNFFNHCAKFSDVISFILPKTFRKPSIINRLDKSFHIIYDVDTPKNSFIFNGKEYDVPCCLQIWEKRSTDREPIKVFKFRDVSNWFAIVSPDDSDFSIQRVGQKAGKIRTHDYKHYSPLSHFFIKAFDERVIGVFEKINFDLVKFNTAGNPSISPNELIQLWINKAKEEGIL